MKSKSLVPLIDLGFLSLGAVLALLTQSQFVEAIPVQLAEAEGSTVTAADEPEVFVTVTPDSLFIDQSPATLDDLRRLEPGGLAVVRADATTSTQRLVDVLSALGEAEVQMTLEVDETSRGKGPQP